MSTTDLYVLVALALLAGVLLGAGAVKAWGVLTERRHAENDAWTDTDAEWMKHHGIEN